MIDPYWEPPAENNDKGFGAANWANIISGLAQGAGKGMEMASVNAANKKEAKEAKRRLLAEMLSKAMGRTSALYNAGQQYGDEGADYQSRAMQQVASGFINAMR